MSLSAKLVALGILLLGLLAWGWKIHHDADRSGYARAQAEYAKASIKANQEREKREAARQAAADEEARHGQERIAKLEADLADTRAAGERLRDAIRTAVARGREDSSPAGSGAGQPSPDPIGVLALVLERADARAGVLAETADRLRIAGQTCEAYADALRR